MGWNVQTVEARARWWALVPSCCVSSSVTTWTGDDIKVDSLKENQGARTRRRKNGNKASQKILQVPTYSGNKGKRTHQARESNHPDNRNRTCSYHGKQGKRVSRKRGMPKVSYIANIKENSIKRKKNPLYTVIFSGLGRATWDESWACRPCSMELWLKLMARRWKQQAKMFLKKFGSVWKEWDKVSKAWFS